MNPTASRRALREALRTFPLWLVVLVAQPAMAQQVVEDQGIAFELTPYVWSFGVGGDVVINGQPFPLDFSLGDAFKFDNIGVSAQLELRERAFTLIASGSYVGVKADSASVRFDSDQYVLQGFLGYRIAGGLDVLIGGRYFNVSAKLTQGTEVDAREQDWIDFVAGLRYEWALSDKWFLRFKGDVGGSTSGDSSSWSLGASGYYRFLNNLAVALQYQLVSVKYETGQGPTKFLYDLNFAGPGLGLMLYVY